MVTVVRSDKFLGSAGAKHFAASLALKEVPVGSKEIVVFLDSRAVVSENWLAPLFHTLSDHPKSSECWMHLCTEFHS